MEHLIRRWDAQLLGPATTGAIGAVAGEVQVDGFYRTAGVRELEAHRVQRVSDGVVTSGDAHRVWRLYGPRSSAHYPRILAVTLVVGDDVVAAVVIPSTERPHLVGMQFVRLLPQGVIEVDVAVGYDVDVSGQAQGEHLGEGGAAIDGGDLVEDGGVGLPALAQFGLALLRSVELLGLDEM